MKLLLDENVPVELAARLLDVFPVVEHVSRLGLMNSDDGEIWEYARRNGYAIVTKDSDFFHRCQFDRSVKIVWVRYGNCSIEQFDVWLQNAAGQMRDFLVEAEEICLTLTRPKS